MTKATIAHLDTIVIDVVSTISAEIVTDTGELRDIKKNVVLSGSEATASKDWKKIELEIRGIKTVKRVDIAVDLPFRLSGTMRLLVAQSYSPNILVCSSFDDSHRHCTYTAKLNTRSELQVYDKALESGLEADQDRLEFRAKQRQGSGVKPYSTEAVEHCERMISNYKSAVDQVSRVLCDQLAYDMEHRGVKQLTGWLRLNQHKIINRSILTDLIHRAGLTGTAKGYIDKARINGTPFEFVSESEFKKLMAVVKKAVKKYNK